MGFIKYKIDADDALLLMENAVAISGEFHGDSAYAVFYETCGEELAKRIILKYLREDKHE